jgi:guanosine-3',5'-bis(diphosphate) 3'-pyrophosphohydrolase
MSLFFEARRDVSVSVLDAINIACVAHRKQKRKDADATPYINHPVEVASLVTNASRAYGTNLSEIVAAAVLHDIVEDTEWTHEDVEKNFGPIVAGYVKEVTNDPLLDRLAQKRAQIEKMPNLSYGAQVIKMADKLSNCLNWPPTWSVERCQGYALLSKCIFDLARDTPTKTFLYLDFKARVLSATITRNGQVHALFPPDRTDAQNEAFLEDFLSGKFDNNNANVPL